MSGSTAVSAQYTREWLEKSSPDSATVNGEQYSVEHSEGFASRLYNSCRTVFQGACTLLRIGAREELAKLYLWGQNFGPTELDTALEYSDDAHSVVLDALGCIGRLLLDEISRLRAAPKFADLDAQAQELTNLVEQTHVVISSQTGEDDHASSDDASSDDSFDTSVGRLSDREGTNKFTQDLRSQIGYLVQLGPTLRQNVLYARKSRVKASLPPVVPFHLSGPAWKYVLVIREKYKNADDLLVNRLGESNWQRHIMVREQMEAIQRRTSDADEPRLDDTPFYNSRDDLYSAFRPYSTFHDSGIGTSIPEDALSHTSFLSSNPEGESLRVPAAPEEVAAGKPFQCPFCGDTLGNIRNRIGWKMHVFADLRPYICTFANCSKELAQFTTRAAWADHEFTEHRIIRSWSCPECPKQCESEQEWDEHLEERHQQTFSGPKYQVALSMACNTLGRTVNNEACPLCQFVPGKSRGEFVKHVGRHMEEIALMALPPEDEDTEEEEQDTDSESYPSLKSTVGGPESKQFDGLPNWLCCQCSAQTLFANASMRCPNCSHSRCSGCVISHDNEWRPSEHSSDFAQANTQGSFEALQQSSPEPVAELSRDELHAVKHSDGQSEYRTPSSNSRDATKRQMQQSISPSTSASISIDPPATNDSPVARASEMLRVIDSSPYTEAWAADGSHPTLPPLGSGPYVGGSFRCQHPGCTAMPFQTQYLLNSHANIHSQNRPHYCPVKGCPRSEGGKGFKRKNEMIRHGLVHRSPGYICPFCPEREHKYPRPDNLQRHVRVHHADRDLDDPLLRAVLSQRTEGGRRRHIDESDCADKQQPSPSGKQISPQPSTSREVSGTLDAKTHPVMNPQGFPSPLYRKGDSVTLKYEIDLVTGSSIRNRYIIDNCVTRTAPSRRYRYHVVSDTGEGVSKWAHEDELEYYTEDNSNGDNDLQVKAREQSDEPQNQDFAEISDDSDNGPVTRWRLIAQRARDKATSRRETDHEETYSERERIIESRVSRIKARVAELIKNEEAPSQKSPSRPLSAPDSDRANLPDS